jgi:Winged helix DNA-binding domain
MAKWSFLTNQARALLCIARDPGVRLRDIASTLGITERHAYGIVSDLTDAGYVVKVKDGRRNRYEIQADLPLRRTADAPFQTIGHLLDMLAGTDAWRPASVDADGSGEAHEAALPSRAPQEANASASSSIGDSLGRLQ